MPRRIAMLLATANPRFARDSMSSTSGNSARIISAVPSREPFSTTQTVASPSVDAPGSKAGTSARDRVTCKRRSRCRSSGCSCGRKSRPTFQSLPETGRTWHRAEPAATRASVAPARRLSRPSRGHRLRVGRSGGDGRDRHARVSVTRRPESAACDCGSRSRQTSEGPRPRRHTANLRRTGARFVRMFVNWAQVAPRAPRNPRASTHVILATGRTAGPPSTSR